MKIINKIKVATFFVLFFTGVAFGAWGMLTEPPAVIDSSVLILIAQIFVLAASIWGFEVKFDLQNGKFSAGKGHQDDHTEQ